jgi:hypothetical protein
MVRTSHVLQNKTLAVALLAGILTLPAAAGTVAGITSAVGPDVAWRGFLGSDQSATVGWTLQVGDVDIELLSLGVFDKGGNGLNTSHGVGIWTDAGTLLRQTTIPAGTAAGLVDGYRYESVAALTLTAGQKYRLGAYYGPVADRCSGTACGDELIYNATSVFANGVTFVQSVQQRGLIGARPLGFPDVDAGIPQGVFGPNFLMTEIPLPPPPPSSVPEPGSVGLAGLGSVALLVRARWKRSAGQ